MTAALILPQRDTWTVEDLKELPPDLPYELVNGRLILLSPDFIHQDVCFRVMQALVSRDADRFIRSFSPTGA